MATYHSLDKGWRFREMKEPFFSNAGAHPMGAESPSYDDADWRLLNLPHDWSIEGCMAPEPYVMGSNVNIGQNAFLHGGIAWYRRHVDVCDMTHEYLLQIDGSYRQSEVWVNGIYVGGQDNGYFSYALDITSALHEGDNVIAVRCNNLDTPNCRWYTGSGLYRHVYLVERHPTHMAHWGVALTTPRVAADSALVHLAVELEGPEGAVEVATDLLDPQGNLVAHGLCVAALRDGTGLAEMDLTVRQPERWSLDTPVLYTAQITLKRDGQAVDSQSTTFGIRSIEYRKGQGFLLNGVPTKFQGICMHHDGGPLGAAVPETVWEARLKTLKDIGCNAIRTSHNPPAPEVLDLCDRLGFLVMDELCDKWEPPHYLNFARNWKEDVKGWIRRDRNHPSVVMWSVGNENDWPGSEYLLSRYRMLCDAVRKLDPSRPAMAAAERGGIDNPAAQLHLMARGVTDFVGCNYSEQWYEDMLAQDPDILILGTENFVYFRSNKQEFDSFDEMCPWFDVEKDDRVMGNFLWTGIDYLGESWGRWPMTGSLAGLMDVTGFDKPVSDFYRTFWKKEQPQVHLCVYRQSPDHFKDQLLSQWNFPAMDRIWAGEEDAPLYVASYTNCEEVELLLNGRSLGVQRLSDSPNRILKWAVPFEPGELLAIARTAGQEVDRHALRTPGAPVAIRLEAKVPVLSANEWDTSPVEATLVDAQGNTCPWQAGSEVSFSVSGTGSLTAVGNGSLTFHGPFQGDTVPVSNDRCMAYVRAGALKGVTTLTAAWEGYSGSCEIRVQ